MVSTDVVGNAVPEKAGSSAAVTETSEVLAGNGQADPDAKWVSRFVLESDPQSRHFVFDLPGQWWSRPYEYRWASEFAEPGDVALDAASGVPHPLKFFLVDHCAEVHAVDIDERITDDEAIRRDVREVYGTEVAQHLIDGVEHRKASLTALPYPDGKFDKVYCISVLEHLSDPFNKWPWLLPLRSLLGFLSPTIEASLREFRRVLKDDGLMVLTFDHPRISLQYVQYLVDRLGLEFAGPCDFSKPAGVLNWEGRGLCCVRVVLRKRRS